MLHVTDLTFSYPGQGTPALSGVSLSAGRGEVLGVVGTVGAGKTTLCKSLAGLAPKLTGGESSGEISVGGRDPRQAQSAPGSRVGLVQQDYSAQITRVTALDEVMAPLINDNVPVGDAAERARKLLIRVGLPYGDFEDTRTWEMSGGQQQRVAIAATLALEPDVLILDSSTGMLDPQGKREVTRLVTDLAGDVTLVVVDEVDFLTGIADRVLVLSEGVALAHGELREVFGDGQTLHRAGLELPTPLRLARAIHLDAEPVTVSEFGRAVGRVPERRPDPEPAVLDTPGRTVIHVDNAAYAYPNGTAALRPTDLRFRAGQVHAVVGGNGAGKTTLTKLIVGLIRPVEGRVVVDGADTCDRTAAALAETVGTVFQNPDEQLTERTVAAEIAYPLRRRRYEKTGWFSRRERYDEAFIDDRVRQVCEFVGLDEHARQQDPTLLPSGHRKLVAIAAALAPNPAALLLDEPAAGVDGGDRQTLHRVIEALRAQGTAVVVIEHDMELVCELADRVTVLHAGRPLSTGSPHEVFAREQWDRLAELAVDPPLAARLAGCAGARALTYGGAVSALSPVLEVG